MRWTPDGACRSHWELVQGLQGGRAVRYEGDSGVVYPERCPCGSAKRRMNWAEVDFRRRAFCGSCNAQWPCEVVTETYQGRGTSPLKYTFAEMVTDLTRVMIEAERADMWGFRAFYLRAGERAGGMQAVADRAHELWPRAPRAWNRHNVTLLVPLGRQAVRAALVARDLLYEGDDLFSVKRRPTGEPDADQGAPDEA